MRNTLLVLLGLVFVLHTHALHGSDHRKENSKARVEEVPPGDPRHFVTPWEKGPGDFDVAFLRRFLTAAGELDPQLRGLTGAESLKLMMGLNALRTAPPDSGMSPGEWQTARRRVLSALGELRPHLMREMKSLYFISISPAQLTSAIEQLSDTDAASLRQTLNRLTDARLPLPLTIDYLRFEIARVLSRLDELNPHSLRQYLGDLAKSMTLRSQTERMTAHEAQRLQGYLKSKGLPLSPAEQARLQDELDRAHPQSAVASLGEFMGSLDRPGTEMSKLLVNLNEAALLRLRRDLDDPNKTPGLHDESAQPYRAKILGTLNEVSPGTRILYDEERSRENPRAFFDAHAKCALDELEPGTHPPVEPHDRYPLPPFAELVGDPSERDNEIERRRDEAHEEIRLLQKQRLGGNAALKKNVDAHLARWREKQLVYDMYYNPLFEKRVLEGRNREKLDEILEVFNPIFHKNVRYFATNFLAKPDADRRQYLRSLTQRQIEALHWGLGALLGERRVHEERGPTVLIAGRNGKGVSAPLVTPPLSRVQVLHLRRLHDVVERESDRRAYREAGEGTFPKILAESRLRCLGENEADPPNLARLRSTVPHGPELLNARDRAYFWADNFYQHLQQQSVGHAMTQLLSQLRKSKGTLTPEQTTQVEWANREIEGFLKKEREKFEQHKQKIAPKTVTDIPWLKGEYKHFEPQVVFDDKGGATVKFIPTAALKELQARQALMRGLVRYIGSMPQRSEFYDDYLHPVTPEAALFWYGRFGDRSPQRLMHVETEGPLRSDDSIPIAIAIAMTGGMAAPAAAGGLGVRAPGALRELLSFSSRGLPAFMGRTVTNLGTLAAVETVGELMGPGAALASLPLMMLGQWGVGKAVTTLAPHAGNLLRSGYHRVLYSAAERSVIQGGRAFGLSTAEALAASQVVGEAKFLELARATQAVLIRPGLLKELTRTGGTVTDDIVAQILLKQGLAHLGDAERAFLGAVLRRFRTGGSSITPELAFQQELLHQLGRSRAEVTLGRLLSAAQNAAVEKAHLVGKGVQVGKDGINPPGLGNYTLAQLREKVEILRRAGFSRHEIRALMERGIVGESMTFQSTSEAMGWFNALDELPQLPLIPSASRLHLDISHAERLEIIRDVPLTHLISAPGHHYLRNSQQVLELSSIIQKTNGAGIAVWAETPAILNITTRIEGGIVRVAAVEIVDGNHRIAAGLHSGAWRTIGDIPAGLLQIRVNGRLANGAGIPPRWIPLEVANRSSIQGWRDVSTELLARGPTAEIPGNISSFEPLFAPQDRGIPLSEVLRLTLERLAATN